LRENKSVCVYTHVVVKARGLFVGSTLPVLRTGSFAHRHADTLAQLLLIRAWAVNAQASLRIHTLTCLRTKNGMFFMQLSSLCTGAQHTSTETTTHTNTYAQTRAQARALFKSACISLIHTVAFTGDDMNFARERAYVHAHKDHKHANARTRKRKPSIYATHSKRNGQHFLFPHT